MRPHETACRAGNLLCVDLTGNDFARVTNWRQETGELESLIWLQETRELESKIDYKKQENWSQRLMTRNKRTGVKDWWQESRELESKTWQESRELESKSDDKDELESKTDDKKQENWSQGLMTRNRRSGVTDWCNKNRTDWLPVKTKSWVHHECKANCYAWTVLILVSTSLHKKEGSVGEVRSKRTECIPLSLRWNWNVIHVMWLDSFLNSCL